MAGRTTAIIADDEPRLAEYLKERLAVLWPELVIAGIANNGPDAQALLISEAPDIAFLDIRMPALTGLDVARTANGEVQIVFVTAYDQYALAAFERAAVDYLLKPVSDERLAETVARLKARLASSTPAPDLKAALDAIARLVPAVAGAEKLAWIRASTGQQVRLIAVDDVCYFQANDKYTSVFTADGEALIRTPLKELADQLDAQRFWQVHRGTIVNIRHVATTVRDVTGRVTLTLKSRPEKVAVSARLRAFVQANVAARPRPRAQCGVIPRAMSQVHSSSSHGHRHAHAGDAGHGHRPIGEDGSGARRALWTALAITLGFSVVEAVGGWMAGSLALLSDAGHMVTDAAALGLALFADAIARRPPSKRASYGYGRAEVLAAFVNAMAMLAVVAAIAIEAVRRLLDPTPVAGGLLIGVALAGLAANLVAAWLLSRVSRLAQYPRRFPARAG
jgi:DNA-binding LytR/AlgR family response regulator